MLIIKVLIVIAILIIVRKHLGVFKLIWPLCIGFTVGAALGWGYCSQIIRLGTTFECLEYFGCPQKFAKSILALVGGLITIGPVSAAIWGLFPPNREAK